MFRSVLGVALALALLGAACGTDAGEASVDAAVQSSTSQPPGASPPTDGAPEETEPTPTAPSAASCDDAIQTLGPADALDASVDALDLIAEDRLVGLLLPGHEQRELIGLDYFDAPEQLIFPSTAAPERQLESLRVNRFDEGYNATYAFGVDSYSLFALSFPSPEASSAYHRVYLQSVCSDRGRDMDRLGDTASGVTFITEVGPQSYTHAAIAVGNVEMIFTLCVCIETADHRQVLTDWVSAITAQLAGPSSGDV
ncbi:hypothetical protein [Actinospongicola halichondriae]|uniref:hypothetical protein n=1 Tax=Actinospongicola halichondriae TaxID=3236844 RepID=UPI003D3D2154